MAICRNLVIIDIQKIEMLDNPSGRQIVGIPDVFLDEMLVLMFSLTIWKNSQIRGIMVWLGFTLVCGCFPNRVYGGLIKRPQRFPSEDQ